ncbi:MAG: PD40 domain-containing protein [Cyclobacteriaceae bacterium]|nr:PD40 domain-containing protein [Cyclobacteriaceae bacterium]MCK5368203.1 PD40 domain-containing protein [Cyclobacteriaceae bacterium]
MKRIVIVVLITSLFFSCSEIDELDNEENFELFELFDSIPTNLSDVNSEFDDYNPAYPPGTWGIEHELVFSSNRKSNGEDFDFVSYFLTIMYATEEGTLIEIKGSPIHESFWRQSYNYLNTEYDEFGPFYWKRSWDEVTERTKYAFMFSNNTSGNQDIKWLVYDACHCADHEHSDSISQIFNLENINTGYNEMYPSINDSEFYFTSDRAGSFDLYTTEIINENLFNSYELELSPTIENIEILSSEYDEKCPFVYDDIMVFTSNRLSGYGGYDLYYSIKINNGWSEPVNFGANINSEFDEYRPIIIPVGVSTNNLMIFSSNRPGGLGGFDLYYVGVFK